MTDKFDFHIIANLGENRNNVGSLKVYDSTGKLVLQPIKALGRGSNLPSNGNDHTKQLMRNADTPSGVALCQIIGKSSNTDAFGPYERVHLYKAISGNFLAAEKAGRSEILIHGGKPRSSRGASWYPLHPTHGCIRVRNEDMKTLIDVLKQCGPRGKITIN